MEKYLARLRDDYKTRESFIELKEEERKSIADQEGLELLVNGVNGSRAHYESKSTGWCTIPVDLLVKLETPDDSVKKEETKVDTSKTLVKGDFAKVIRTNNASPAYHAGMTVEVLEIGPGLMKPTAHYASVKTAGGHVHNANVKNLKRIEKKPACTPDTAATAGSTLKVGDYARVLRTKNPSASYHEGVIVKVTGIKGPYAKVTRMTTGYGHTARIENLEKVNTEGNKRKYTLFQILEARQLLDREILGLHRQDLSPVFYVRKDKGTVSVVTQWGLPSKNERATAHCADNDEWNTIIGKMVAICKLTKTAMPTWVRNG